MALWTRRANSSFTRPARRSSRAPSFTFVLAATLAVCSDAAAQPWQFVTVADSNTTIPGHSVKFGGLSGSGLFEPSITNGRIAFVGRGVGNPTISGVYDWQSGVLNRVADQTTPYPGGGNFNQFAGTTSVGEDSSVAFLAAGQQTSGGFAGAFFSTLLGIERAADHNTPVPGGTGNFTSVLNVTRSGAMMVFRGSGSGGERGLYQHSAGGLTIRADNATPIPGGSGNFRGFGPMTRLRAGDLVFRGLGGGNQDGLYLSTPVSLTTVVDSSTPVPGVPGATFSGLIPGGLDLDATVAFIATMGGDESKRPGIYTAQGGSITRLLAFGDPAPGSEALFQRFHTLAFESGRALILAYSEYATQKTLYFRQQDGALLRILGYGDFLEGRFVSDIGIDQQSLSGDQLTFAARMSGNFEGIYTLTIPSPGGLVAGAVALAAGLGRRRA